MVKTIRLDLEKYEAMLRKYEAMSDEELKALPLEEKRAVEKQLYELIAFVTDRIEECKQFIKM